jgi:hypothetical protein
MVIEEVIVPNIPSTPIAQYSLVAKWSSKSDSSLHAINADTSEFSKTGAWALRSDSAKHSINCRYNNIVW